MTREVGGSAGLRLRLRRTGGLAGAPLTRTVDVAELPDSDAEQWCAILAGDGPRGLQPVVPGRTVPDAYTYHLASPPKGEEVILAEHDLPGPVRDLFERTLSE
ncbi:protealysin inhibitor emfourin [Pedococcus sp. 2YAF34]|uniref:protealysin inhibitor emfourin n=1 Tax=Pedococcus sp. 2YAF34 TaxID=3233032 RepID=UPI003F996D2B